jgi:hypothetical protein
LVVPGTTVDLVKAQALIESTGLVIICSHLKENRAHQALACFDKQGFDQHSSKSSPSVLRRNSNRLNVAIAASMVCA